MGRRSTKVAQVLGVPIPSDVRLDDAESLGAFLRQALDKAGIRTKRAAADIARDQVNLYTLNLPKSKASDMAAMVAYRRLIPVFVVTGFLGSGKTTLLNRMLRHPSLKDAAVLVNEFGEVGLDHFLVEKMGVHQTLAGVPGQGQGYGVLRHLTKADAGRDSALDHAPEVVFNYLGQFSPFQSEGGLKQASESVGELIAPDTILPDRLGVDALPAPYPRHSGIRDRRGDGHCAAVQPRLA